MPSQQTEIILDNGTTAKASQPVIISASRSTDIPAFYADWFIKRLQKGYSAWINPFNNRKYYIGYGKVKFIVFWSKNPKPLLRHLDYLQDRDIGCCLHFTLNDYQQENLEPNVPPILERINTFREFSRRLGKSAVIWRFDPLILAKDIGVDTLLAKIGNIANMLAGYTEKLVFSFCDILSYAKVKANLQRNGIAWRDWQTGQMLEFAQRLASLNKNWNLELGVCGEKIDLPGINNAKCIDERLILRMSPNCGELADYLGAEVRWNNSLFGKAPPGCIDIGNGQHMAILKNNKDKGQRKKCQCAKSKDIGQYNTCPHLCLYCYANSSAGLVLANHLRHKNCDESDTITGI